MAETFVCMNPSTTAGQVSSRGIPAGISAAADFVAIASAAWLAFVAASAASILLGWDYAGAAKVFGERALPFGALLCATVGWFFLSGQYHHRSPFWDEARKVFETCAFALMAEGFLLFSSKADGSRLATFLTWILAPFLVMAGRSVLRRLSKRLGYGEARAVVVGRPGEAAAAARALSADAHLGYVVGATLHTVDVDAVLEEAERAGADTAVVALSGDDGAENRLAEKLREAGLRVILVPPVLGYAASGLRMQYVIGEDCILLVDKVDVVPRLSRFSKRFFDVAVASAALAAAAVPMLVVALIVRMDGGPAIFGHERVGTNGRKFRCLKFRSMAVDSAARLEEYLRNDPEARREWEETRKLKNDPRVTRFGKFIRKTALDELPQLINVLRGDMSLVGPRPVTEPELGEFYGPATPLYLSVRPGVTGLWQVSGRNDLSYEQRVSLDAWYVRNWSPWHDTAIILKTIPALLLRRGAY